MFGQVGYVRLTKGEVIMFDFKAMAKKIYRFETYSDLEFHKPYVCYMRLSTKKVYFFDY